MLLVYSLSASITLCVVVVLAAQRQEYPAADGSLCTFWLGLHLQQGVLGHCGAGMTTCCGQSTHVRAL